MHVIPMIILLITVLISTTNLLDQKLQEKLPIINHRNLDSNILTEKTINVMP